MDSLRCGPGDTVKAVQRAGRAGRQRVAGAGEWQRAALALAGGVSERFRRASSRVVTISELMQTRATVAAVGEDDPASWRAAWTFSIAFALCRRGLGCWLRMLEEFYFTHDAREALGLVVGGVCALRMRGAGMHIAASGMASPPPCRGGSDED
ncbi:MAG: hypothetical protein U0V87_13745 [Acidobacteriota bacterium]